MDAKKFQQLQQAQAQAQKKIPLAYQANINDYRAANQSPVFVQHHNMIGAGLSGGNMYPQSPTNTSSSSGPLSPIDIQPQSNKLILKHGVGTNSNLSSAHSSPFHQTYATGEQLYQTPNERTYLAAAGRLQSTANHHHANSLQQQYQQLQQAKMQAQIQTQNEAMQQQQRTFALRQALNPPVPSGHLSQSSSIMSTLALQQQQQHHQQNHQQKPIHQRAPPSSLNLPNQFQPAAGPLKVNPKIPSANQHFNQHEHQLYAQQQHQLQLQLQHQKHLQQQQQHQHNQQLLQQHQQQLQTPNEQSPIYIQQNHPGHVVNQACQTQISAVKGENSQITNKMTPSSEESSSKSPIHLPLDRKKSVGSAQALKSPISKRPPGSPVTLSGWLYKQGSDGLKVWRKRWFVLSEYILYYYKGPEEEKLLGSILLPSYKVSACLPEDKIYRKYAFKCEHQNMRTYWLAAETAESMVQWVRSLTAATMMQGPISSSGESDHNSQPSMTSSSLNNSGENSDSGIHTLQSHQSKMSLHQGQVTPASENSGQSGNGANNGVNNANGGQQPLYANAPPKPRRINDGGYSSPSPEHSIDNERKHQGHNQHQYQQQQQHGRQPQQHHAIYDTRTGNVSSSLHLQRTQQQYSVDNLENQFHQQMSVSGGTSSSIEEEIMRLQKQHQQHQQQLQQRAEDIYGERELYMQKLLQQRFPPQLGAGNSNERRTPDAYGRSKNRILSDYEDIYNLTQNNENARGLGITSAQEALLQEAASYRRPLSPPIYDGGKHIPSMPTRYTPNHLEQTTSPTNALAGNAINLRARPAAALMRPHSADFLEYEARAEAAAAVSGAAGNIIPTASGENKSASLRAPRPKSSLDINRTPDSFYYSEASYAEKMRKSALYLQNPQNAGAQPQLAGGYRTATDFLSPIGSGMNTIGYENPYERSHKHNEILNEAFNKQSAASSIPRVSRLTASTSGAHIRSTSTNPPITSKLPQEDENDITPPHFSPTASTAEIIQQNEQFLRSASARLPKRVSGLDDDFGSSSGNNCSSAVTSPPTARASPNNGPDGERKREESMKRLLEWKQRMLQSPLTRKGVQHTNNGSNMTAMSKLGSNPNILLASTTIASGAHYPSKLVKNSISSIASGGKSIQRSRSETHANTGPAGYNSYSSDDEASISVRNVRNLPKSNLTVKPDPSDLRQIEEKSALYNGNVEQRGKMTNSYYGSAQDTKYAKTTSLVTDRNTSAALTNPFNNIGSGFNYNSYGIKIDGNNLLTTSTPLHPSTVSEDYYGSNSVANTQPDSLFTDLQHHPYQQQQLLYNGYQAYPTGAPYSMRRVGSRAEIDILERDTSTQLRNLNVSAGDLLSRTHEELVLLLIQLRRQNSNTARAIEQCCSDIHEVQNRLRTAEGLTRAESIQRLDYLKQHLLDLERQYEKSKPLVNLVDNMVKLGSLYRNSDGNSARRPSLTRNDPPDIERLEFNQLVEERRLLQEEQMQWDRLNPDQSELESKVQQLYIFDQLLQEESTTLQNLQRDKEDLEKALGGIRARIHESHDTPMALEAAKKQQFLLERELSRVHQLLADNSKKLEQTVAGNSRLEQELLILRQKLQIPKATLAQGISETYASNATAMLESELKRVQDLVGDMQRQRQELSEAVRQLTENSTKLYQEIGKKDMGSTMGNGSIKKRSNSTCWIETDLDSMQCVNRTLNDSTVNLSTPLYVDTSSANGHILNGSKASNSNLSDYNTSDNYNNDLFKGSQNNYRYNDSNDQIETSGVESDGFLETNPFANLTNQEKQEIKTVRIVKRESERRNRDRSERSVMNSSQLNLDQVLEEEHLSNGITNGYTHINGYNEYEQTGSSSRSKSLPRNYNEPPSKPRHQNKIGHNGSLKMNGSNYYNGLMNGKSKESYKRSSAQNQSALQPREHLNPLANAYFAKQLQQQQQNNHYTKDHSARTSLRNKTDSVQSLNKSITDLSSGPVFQSEAARQIINEISAGSASEDTEKVVEKVPSQHKHRRAVPREKRRHYTAPNNVNMKAMESVQAENDMNRNNTNWRAKDDLDMDLALRPRLNAPDVVRSALGQGEKISENTIDNLLLAPNKIVIPERYIPETTPELSPEEKKRRQEKVESIKKMLAEAPISTANDQISLPSSKLNAEKKQREHLLQLNQILAQQVMQMSKIVAEKAMTNSNNNQGNEEDRKSESPTTEPLPTRQQRDNYFS